MTVTVLKRPVQNLTLLTKILSVQPLGQFIFKFILIFLGSLISHSHTLFSNSSQHPMLYSHLFYHPAYIKFIFFILVPCPFLFAVEPLTTDSHHVIHKISLATLHHYNCWNWFELVVSLGSVNDNIPKKFLTVQSYLYCLEVSPTMSNADFSQHGTSALIKFNYRKQNTWIVNISLTIKYFQTQFT